jgi:proteasome alpha subunit
MVKYGIAPLIKQAFEEVFKAPFIVKLLLAELGHKAGKDSFLVINYDGTFEEGSHSGVLAANRGIEQEMVNYLRAQTPQPLPLDRTVGVAIRAWALGDRLQSRMQAEEGGSEGKPSGPVDAEALYTHVRETVKEKTIECVLLDRTQSGSSKYRALKPDELGRLLPSEMKSSLA